MKSERRHELQHNALADWLVETGKALAPFQNHVLLGITAVLVVALVYVYYTRSTSATAAQAWEELSTGLNSANASALSDVVEKYPGSNAADVAAVVAGDLRLASACNQLFNNKATARQDLNKAIELYRLVREQSRTPWLLERATFGLARAKESTAEADSINQAKHLYEEILQTWPNGTFAGESKRRLADLNSPETKRMYDDFAKWEKPVFSTEGGLPGAVPGFDKANIPEESPVAPTKNEAADKPAEKQPSETKPAASAEKNAAPAKAAEKVDPNKQAN